MVDHIKPHLDVSGISEAVSLLADIVNGAQDAIITRDPEGSIVSWNPAAEALLGFSEEEVIGRHMSEMVVPSLQTEQSRIIKDVLEGTRVESYESQLISKWDVVRDVSATTSPLASSTGRIMGSCTILRDISTRRCSERERDAQSLDPTHEEVVHDVIDPLVRAYRLLDEAQDIQALKQSNHDHLDEVVTRANEAQQLIEDVLVMYGMYAPGERRALDPRKLIARAAATVPGVKVEFGLLPPTLMAEEKSLLRASRSLFENAAIHAHDLHADGEPALVFVHGEETPTRWDIDFDEEGTRIPDDELKQLFMPRFLNHPDYTHVEPAVGLASVDACAKAHGGRVDAENIEGVGLRVHISIPKIYRKSA